MKCLLQKPYRLFIHLAMPFACCMPLLVCAQSSSKSLLINHGGTSCGNSVPQQQFFSGTLTSNPTLVSTCDVGIPYYNVLASYNPADHKVYFAYMPGSTTSVYVADFNFGGSISCPTLSTPTYTYNYSMNQLCFDNDGNNYVFLNFDQASGTAHLAQVNIITGDQVAGTDKLVHFPPGNVPNSVLFGDIVILPNGRMFATFGNAPSKLFELTHFSGSGTDADAVFLANLPRPCFSIGYVDGNLTIAGSDGGGCYYYIWDINSATLSNSFPFPLGKNSSDMSNVTVAIGATKELLNATTINYNTSTVYYQVVVKNKGNIFLNNVQAVDNLASVFGHGNVSNVSVSFASNPAGLQLNSEYDGVNNINLLAPNQVLNNYPSSIDSFVINIRATVTNLSSGTVYLNSATASGEIGSGANYLAVSDSSNNGDYSKMDLDGNAVSDDPGENNPTPFVFGYVLPLSALDLKGAKNGNEIWLNWKGLSDLNVSSYEVQRSVDGRNFQTIGTLTQKQAGYRFNDGSLPLNQPHLYYRIRVSQPNRHDMFSNTLLIASHETVSLGAYPNPFSSVFSLTVPSATPAKATLLLRDISGRVLLSKPLQLEKGNNYFTLAEAEHFQAGAYVAEVAMEKGSAYIKLIKK